MNDGDAFSEIEGTFEKDGAALMVACADTIAESVIIVADALCEVTALAELNRLNVDDAVKGADGEGVPDCMAVSVSSGADAVTGTLLVGPMLTLFETEADAVLVTVAGMPLTEANITLALPREVRDALPLGAPVTDRSTLAEENAVAVVDAHGVALGVVLEAGVRDADFVPL